MCNEALRVRWGEVGHFYEDDGPLYGVDNDDAFAMDEEWDFLVWGDPEPARYLSYLTLT